MILRPASSFSRVVFLLITFLLSARAADGRAAPSGSFSAQYAGDDFDWQTLETDALKVNWYEGDANFGQAALQAASMGLESINRLMPLDLVQPVEIFIYANVEDLQSTLAPNSEPWVAGHADPALGVVRVVIEPGAEQGLAMEQRIPHELMHVMLYRHVGAGYYHLPAWLREGMATLAETYRNADYDRVLTDAATNDRLIPLQDLCVEFPEDTGQAFLAYSEARSFTGFLHDKYGSTGLLKLAASYADGVDCEQGSVHVFGMPLANLEAQWRSSMLGQNTLLSVFQNSLPYLALLCLVLIIPLFGILATLRKRTPL